MGLYCVYLFALKCKPGAEAKQKSRSVLFMAATVNC